VEQGAATEGSYYNRISRSFERPEALNPDFGVTQNKSVRGRRSFTDITSIAAYFDDHTPDDLIK
jgi:hypothetical protein